MDPAPQLFPASTLGRGGSRRRAAQRYLEDFYADLGRGEHLLASRSADVLACVLEEMDDPRALSFWERARDLRSQAGRCRYCEGEALVRCSACQSTLCSEHAARWAEKGCPRCGQPWNGSGPSEEGPSDPGGLARPEAQRA